MVIEKKQFMGDRSLRHYVIPKDTVEIGDWAFAGCKGLTDVTIPSSVERIGRNVFEGCDHLTRIFWYQEKEAEGDDLAELMAFALRFFKTDARMVTLRSAGREAWLSFWDESCKAFLRTSDEEGFKPFLAGGEEDYEDEREKRKEHCRMMRLRKAEVLLCRLLSEEKVDPFYLDELRKNDMALKLFAVGERPWKKMVELYERAGILTQENIQKTLAELPEGSVELRALLLRKTSIAKADDWTL